LLDSVDKRIKYRGQRHQRTFVSFKRILIFQKDHSFYRAMLDRAQYCYNNSSVCLPVMLRDRDHIGWNTSNIISRLASLGYSLFVDPNIMDLL